MSLREFGLPVSPAVSSAGAAVQEVGGLQPFVDFLSGRFGPHFESVPLSVLVDALRGWQWAPSAASSPVGSLLYVGSGALPPRATVDPALATTALRAPSVVAEELPLWQRPVWDARPLNAAMFDRLSVVDCDREFLMGVVHNGVLLVPDLAQMSPFFLQNYSSALEAHDAVSAVVATEVAQGWVLPVAEPSPFCHPLGAVPKSDGGIRVIHDHSVPVGVGVNDHEVYVRYTWDSLDSALRFLVPEVFMARLDISAYYRHFMVHPSHWVLQGFVWDGVPYVDSRVQFGLRLAPELAHRFTMFIKRVLHANGLSAVVGVMDDYLLLHCDRRLCLVMLAVASALLADLGFSVNFKPGKTVLPARSQKFVGVVINSARMTLSLPAEKLQALLSDVAAVVPRRKVSRKVLQRLVGKMQWASRVVYGGRVFMRGCLDGLSTSRHPGHHITLNQALRDDLAWWLSAASLQNGCLSIAPTLPTFFVYTDACLAPVPSVGVFCAGAFVSLAMPALSLLGLPVPTSVADINPWECFAVLVAVALFAEWWRGSRVVFFCDNAASVSWLNSGAPKAEGPRSIVRALFSLCVQSHVRLVVQHIPGEQNVLADALSRRQWVRFGPACQTTLDITSPFLSSVLPTLQAL